MSLAGRRYGSPTGPLLLEAGRRLISELAIAEVQAFKDAGGGCLVDVSSIGIRTDLAGIAKVVLPYCWSSATTAK